MGSNGLYLQWEGKRVYRQRIPTPRILEHEPELSAGQDSPNLIIEGDNLQDIPPELWVHILALQVAHAVRWGPEVRKHSRCRPSRVATMLDLNSDRWKRLDHAYGSAGDVPELVEQLKTAPTRERGAEQSAPWASLHSALCHQLTVYTASYAALPHLASLAASRPPRERFDFLEAIQ